MNFSDYLLIPIVLFIALLYPLLRKAVSLLEIFVNKYIQKCAEKQTTDNTTSKMILNLKLLAYERIILFTERMKPDSLVPRTVVPTLTNKEYQLLLINEIRKEFEYNLSQQLYLSENAWNVTANFKDQIITLINTAAAECEPQNTAGELAKKILEQYIHSEIKTEQVLRIIKADIA